MRPETTTGTEFDDRRAGVHRRAPGCGAVVHDPDHRRPAAAARPGQTIKALGGTPRYSKVLGRFLRVMGVATMHDRSGYPASAMRGVSITPAPNPMSGKTTRFVSNTNRTSHT